VTEITRIHTHGRPGLLQLIAAAGGSTLLTGLVSWWDLDEESGVRADEVGSYTLTDNNTVGFDSGRIGNAADYVNGQTEYLTYTNYGGLNGQSEFTVACWMRTPIDGAASGSCGVLNLRESGDTTTTFKFALTNDASVIRGSLVVGYGDSSGSVSINTPSNPVAGEWHFWAFHVDGDTVTFELNRNGTLGTGSLSGKGPYTSTATDFAIHSSSSSPTTGGERTMEVDLVGIWARALTSDELDELYNLGASIKYQFTDNGEGFRQDLVAYYKLEEASGARADSVGSNDLADVNTVLNTTGISGNCATFVAAQQEHLTLDTGSNVFSLDTDRSMFAWVKADDNTTRGIINVSLAGGSWPNDCAASVYHEADKVKVLVGHDGPGNTATTITGYDLDDGDWHLVGMKYNSDLNEIFAGCDGVWSTGQTVSGNLAVAGDTINIGTFFTNMGWWNGEIDEAMIYRRALSTDEFEALFNSRSGRFHDFQV
jgi:hypothetical protein